MDDQIKMLLDDRDRKIAALRIELRQAKEMERKLWVAVAHLQAAAGEANGWGMVGQLPNGDNGGYDYFDKHLSTAEGVIGGIVGLTPA